VDEFVLQLLDEVDEVEDEVFQLIIVRLEIYLEIFMIEYVALLLLLLE